MNTRLTFPPEFKKHLIRDLDREFALILTIVFAFLSVFFWHMSRQPVTEISLAEVREYTEKIHYRVKIEIPAKRVPVHPVPSEDIQLAVVTIDEPADSPVKPESHPNLVSQDTKATQRQDKRRERVSAQQLKREQAQEALRKISYLASATAKNSRLKSSGGDLHQALGLEQQRAEVTDLKNMIGIAGTEQQIVKVKKSREQGLAFDETAEIDIAATDVDYEGAEDLEMAQATLNLVRESITTRGRAAQTKGRNSSEVSELVMQNQNQVKSCFWTYKRRDSNLTGRVVVEFVIRPDGTVATVRFREKSWSNSQLGPDLERCIKNVISIWQFPPIEKRAGNVNAQATFIFE